MTGVVVAAFDAAVVVAMKASLKRQRLLAYALLFSRGPHGTTQREVLR